MPDLKCPTPGCSNPAGEAQTGQCDDCVTAGYTHADQPKQPFPQLANSRAGQCVKVAAEGSLAWGTRCVLQVGHDGAHLYGSDPFDGPCEHIWLDENNGFLQCGRCKRRKRYEVDDRCDSWHPEMPSRCILPRGHSGACETGKVVL